MRPAAFVGRCLARLRRLLHCSLRGCRPVDVPFQRDDGTILDEAGLACSCRPTRVFYVPAEVHRWIDDAVQERNRAGGFSK